MSRLVCRVAGVTYGKRQAVIAGLAGKEKCHIVPEPENDYDHNALAVYVVVGPREQRHIGYLPRAIAARLAGVEASSIAATIKEVAGGYKTAAGNIAAYGVMLLLETPDAAGDLSVL